MSTLTVGYIVGVVEKKALDEANDDFTQAELIGLYILALRFIVSLVPRAYTITTSELLASGTLQSIPATGLVLSGIIDMPTLGVSHPIPSFNNTRWC